MKILGVSAFYHDSSACLLHAGRIVAAAQEERFSRVKHDPGFPGAAIAYCLEQGELGAHELDAIVFYEKPFRRLERLLDTYFAFAPKGFAQFIQAMPHWLRQKIWIKALIRDRLEYSGPVLFCEHHEAHAASAFFASPFAEAAFLTLDGVGEWATASFGVGQGSDLEIHAEIRFPHSLGLLYSAFTTFCGFRVNSGEYKLMGLAPYGEPRFVKIILEELVDLKEDGSFHLNQAYFNYCTGTTMTGRRFAELFGGPPRRMEAPLTQRELDMARSVQVVTEEIMLRMARHVHRQTGQANLCLAGGVTLNCVANGRILREGPFERLWIQPAAGDAGAALGAALYGWHLHFRKPRAASPQADLMQGAYLGPEYSDEAIRQALVDEGATFKEYSPDRLAEEVAGLLAGEQVVGWFQGRMEFGPRALGNRSILADARSPRMQRQVNLKIKFREGFRPFAPIVTEEDAAEWFSLDVPSPYMLLVAPVHPDRLLRLGEEDSQKRGLDRLDVARSTVPAVTHVDNSARIQTVSAATNPLMHRLLLNFKARTGCPVLVNTSFNVRGEPIVCSPGEALRCFLATDIDALAIGRFLLIKNEQAGDLLQRYPRGARALD